MPFHAMFFRFAMRRKSAERLLSSVFHDIAPSDTAMEAQSNIIGANPASAARPAALQAAVDYQTRSSAVPSQAVPPRLRPARTRRKDTLS